ncbi:AAA family ATPase [Burkholderia sp. USMB20]|uniref:AAA family ATPase n=1 Tax=Burkholderia sp. USMB20 TaxID=1571773 RepID=UPI0005E2FA29|nr:AAA family ATPase [Burkholderia sp. USMB20]TGN96473.1 hypothetical protein PL79_013835 [Burkholderia sp. USMB20]
MLKSVVIENYKGLEHLEVPNMAYFNLVGGRNDVGKSSLLEAIFAYFDRVNPTALFSHLGWRGITTVAGTPENLWGPAFSQFDLSRIMSIAGTDTNGITDIVTFRLDRNHVRPTAFTPFTGGVANIGTLKSEPGQVALAVRAKRGTKTLQETFVTFNAGGFSATGSIQESQAAQAAYLTIPGRLNDANGPIRLTQLDSEGKTDQVLAAAKLIEPRVEGLSVGAGLNGTTFINVAIKDLPKKVPLSYLGSGVSVVVNAVLAILTAPGGMVLLDELEVGIHHSSLEIVIKALSEAAFSSKCQVVATSHSYECIRAAFNVFEQFDEKRFAYHRLERNKESRVVAKTYPKEALAYALDSEWEVR